MEALPVQFPDYRLADEDHGCGPGHRGGPGDVHRCGWQTGAQDQAYLNSIVRQAQVVP